MDVEVYNFGSAIECRIFWKIKSDWYYSGQNAGVIKLQHVGVIVTPFIISKKPFSSILKAHPVRIS